MENVHRFRAYTYDNCTTLQEGTVLVMICTENDTRGRLPVSSCSVNSPHVSADGIQRNWAKHLKGNDTPRSIALANGNTSYDITGIHWPIHGFNPSSHSNQLLGFFLGDKLEHTRFHTHSTLCVKHTRLLGGWSRGRFTR